MADERCEVTELLVSECAHCRPAPKVEHSRDWRPARRITARFDSHLGCGHWATEDDTIIRTTSGEYVCEDCADYG